MESLTTIKRGLFLVSTEGLAKKMAKIGYFHKSGFESSIEEEISFSKL